MSDRVSPLGADFRPGKYGNTAGGVGVFLSETTFGFLGEMAAFSGSVEKVEKLAASLTKIEGVTLFPIAANRWFIAGPETIAASIQDKLKPSDGSLVDLSHGRTSFLVTGPKAEWVLSKLYAIDFSANAFAVGTGLSTTHHNIFTQIHRPYEQSFDLFVFRSFARSFWHTLQRAAEETGYEVV